MLGRVEVVEPVLSAVLGESKEILLRVLEEAAGYFSPDDRRSILFLVLFYDLSELFVFFGLPPAVGGNSLLEEPSGFVPEEEGLLGWEELVECKPLLLPLNDFFPTKRQMGASLKALRARITQPNAFISFSFQDRDWGGLGKAVLRLFKLEVELLQFEDCQGGRKVGGHSIGPA